jgi:UDP-2,3-diacylglucosamine hydrolase
LIDDPTLIERNGKRLLLCHGDTLCTDDVAYQRTRTILRSPEWQNEVKAKSLSGTTLARKRDARAKPGRKRQ